MKCTGVFRCSLFLFSFLFIFFLLWASPLKLQRVRLSKISAVTTRPLVILKSPYRHVTYQRNIRDKMLVTFGVRSVVAKDTV